MPPTDRSPARARIRPAAESDYDYFISRLDDWWDGRDMRAMLPRLFFQHFAPTTFVFETDRQRVAFLAGFVSQTDSTIAYVHFVGVDPGHRRSGLGRQLYEHFFRTVGPMGVRRVRAITGPMNQRSIAFHGSMGFRRLGAVPDYDGPGADRVLFERVL